MHENLPDKGILNVHMFDTKVISFKIVFDLYKNSPVKIRSSKRNGKCAAHLQMLESVQVNFSRILFDPKSEISDLGMKMMVTDKI